MGSEKKEDFKITEDEVKKIGEALKDEQFRKLFLEYAEEIQNPENRKIYEQEIAQMEQERGMNVEFIHPQPGHVLKTSVDGNVKAFINICQNDKMGKPVAKRQTSSDGKSGVNWSIPHSHSPPRDDLDKHKVKCRVYDVVFHPDTYRMSKSNIRFRGLVEDTAIDGIERQFGVKVDRKNITRPNLPYKGTPTATVIRSKANEPAKPLDEDDPIRKMPYPFDEKSSEEKAKEMADAVKRKKEAESKKAGKTKRNQAEKRAEDDATVPKYTITHRSDMDLQEYRNTPDSRPSTRPKALVVSIELPLLANSKPVELDIFEKKLVLQSTEPAKYKLDLELPYAVDESQGSAKFDKSNRCLIVTLPVIPEEMPKLPNFIEEIKPENEPETDEVENKFEAVENPLIEVIGTTEANAKLVSKEEENVIDNKIGNECPAYLNHTPKISYGFPTFEFSQDFDTVTFIFKVKKIVPDSVSKLFPLPNVCHIKFMAKGASGFPLHYSFLAKFSAKNCFVPEHCSFEVNNNNAVLLLLKEKDSRQTWETFQAGTSLEELQELHFETDQYLLEELERIEAECVTGADNRLLEEKSVEVTEMTRKKLSIKIQNKKKAEDRPTENTKQTGDRSADDEFEEGDECPLSADIEVVHEKVIPNLHGILKQRTISESSEDPCLSASSSGSPESPRDEFFKKSVKFNDRVDQATFKSKAAVSQMTQSLKSKRRRNRKKEKRSRKNSGSSDGSSDEHRHSDDHSDHCDKNVEVIEELTNEEVDEETSDNQEKQDYIDSTETFVEETKVDQLESGIGNDPSSDNAKQEKLIQDIKEKLAVPEEDDKCDSDDEMDNTPTDVQVTENTKLKEENGNENFFSENVEDKIERNEEENTISIPSSMINKPSDLTNIIGEGDSVIKIKASEKTSGEDSGVECSEGSGDKGDKSDVETVLSWNDNLESQDHRTECAFQFSNAMIYDLDID